MISVYDLTLKFGKQILFDKVDLRFKPGYCYGLIGANGAGKSTFLKLLAKQIQPDEGEVTWDKGIQIGVLQQDQYAYDQYTVLDTVLIGNTQLWKIQQEKDALYAKANLTDEEGLRVSELETEFIDKNGYTIIASAGELLEGLGIETTKHNWSMKQLTGGWKFRVLLAQVLYAQPDVLLLDEPTNHLDIKTIDWLEDYLNAYDGTIIVISHDRHFLNHVCTHICDVDRQKVTIYTGNYDFFEENSKQILDAKLSENAQKEKRISELKEFIARFSANASKSAQATSRAKLLEKIELEPIIPSSRQYPKLKFKAQVEPGKDILTVKGLCKSYDKLLVLNNFNIILGNDEKLAVLGSNGIGKTTLIKTLLSNYSPEKNSNPYLGIKQDYGSVKWGETVRLNSMPQDVNEELYEDITALEWLRKFAPLEDSQILRGTLGKMLFSGDQQEKKISVLSGGERQRMFLARIMLEGGNVIVLDEPTNHMDLESIVSLGKALADFPYTVIFSSHDQDLIAKVATRILELKPNGNFVDFKGTYSDYLAFTENQNRRNKK
jgi:ATPase subunit of ABC transporter with duplicated ATPase domains